MVELTNFQVTITDPGQNTNNINTLTSINITFNRDLDRSSITNGITVFAFDSSNRVHGMITIDVSSRTLVFQPALPLLADTKYTVHIQDTILDILGNHCKPYSFTFTTSIENRLPTPVIISPVALSIVGINPILKWNAVEDATAYEIEVSNIDTFADLVWHSILISPTVEDNIIEVYPDIRFISGNEYYWRVRAFKDIQNPAQTTTSKFSNGSKFKVVDNQDPFIVPEDQLDPLFRDDIDKVIEIFPELNFSNVAKNLKIIYAKLTGKIDYKQIKTKDWYIYGQHISACFNIDDYNAEDPDSTNSNHKRLSGNWVLVYDDSHNETYIIFFPKEVE